MKTKKCKVKYVEDLDTSIEVSCTEIRVSKYKIYGRTITGNYQLLATKKDKQKAIDYANNLNPAIYDGRLLIEHDEETDTDIPIDLER